MNRDQTYKYKKNIYLYSLYIHLSLFHPIPLAFYVRVCVYACGRKGNGERRET